MNLKYEPSSEPLHLLADAGLAAENRFELRGREIRQLVRGDERVEPCQERAQRLPMRWGLACLNPGGAKLLKFGGGVPETKKNT